MMNVDEYKLPLKKVIEEFELEKIYETDDLDSVMITNTDVNRPGLQMVGFFDYFDPSRIQGFGTIIVFRLWERLNLLTLNSSMPTRERRRLKNLCHSIFPHLSSQEDFRFFLK